MNTITAHNAIERTAQDDMFTNGLWGQNVPLGASDNIAKFIQLFVTPAMLQAKALGYAPNTAYLALSRAGEVGTSTRYFDLVTSSTADFRSFLEGWAISKAKGYVNLGYRNEDLGANRRGSYENIIGIPGLWADIDIVGPGHKEQHLPPTMEAAMDLIREATPSFLPTHFVTSGGGIHCYWFIKTPWFFKDAQEKTDAQMMLRGINFRIQKAARKHDWKIDNVSDLARLLRVPGTYNMKDPNNPQLVRLLPWV